MILGVPFLGGQEIVVLLILGVLLFGRKLPELGRSVGKTVVEFKKGLRGMEDEVETAGHATLAKPDIEPEPIRPPLRITSSAPKFEDNSNQRSVISDQQLVCRSASSDQ